jgi:HSP20 family protein
MMTQFADPFEALLRLQRAVETARSSNWFGLGTTSAGAFPPLNVFQKGDDFVVVAEIPGVSKSDLDIKVKDGQLRLSGKKTVQYDERASPHRRERIAGSFDRTVSFPTDIDPDGGKAEYRDGVLAVFVPRAERAKPRTIEIA